MSPEAFGERDAELRELAERLLRGVAALGEVQHVEIGASPKEEVYRQDKIVLYRYMAVESAPDERRVRAPLLICYALVNRPYMMDLQPDRSLIRGLLRRGVDVWLIDWGRPDGADRYRTLEDYVLGYLPNCVARVLATTGAESLNLLGVCQGGALSLCYAALHPQRVRNLITMVTPVDFHTPDNLLAKWVRAMDLDALSPGGGNVQGSLLNALFLALRPFRLTSQKYVDLLERIDDRSAVETFVRMEKWIFDSPDQPGEMFRQFLALFIKENRLVAGGAQIGGRTVDLKDVRIPLLNIYARDDHLTPPASSKALRHLVGASDYTEHEFQGGHIGVYVSGSAQREIPELIAGWLTARDGR